MMNTLKEAKTVNRKILLTVLELAVVLLATPYIGIAHATPSATVNGTITVLSGTQLKEIPLSDGNRLYRYAVTEQWSGDIDAVGSTTNSIWLTHDLVIPPSGPPAGLPPPDYTINIFEVLTFQGNVLGQSGTFSMAIYLHFSMTENYGNWVILGGTDGLAHLHGQGTESEPAPFTYTYTGQIHF